MDDDDGLKDSLRLQFKALQEQQEKRLQRRLEKQKEKELGKSTSNVFPDTRQDQDDLNLAEQDHVTETLGEKYVFITMLMITNIFKLYGAEVQILA